MGLMRGFEVSLNRTRMCVAAFEGEGSLIAVIDHIYQKEPLKTWLRVLGSPHAVQEHLRFADLVLQVGDEVRVKVVETSDPADPVERVDVSLPKKMK